LLHNIKTKKKTKSTNQQSGDDNLVPSSFSIPRWIVIFNISFIAFSSAVGCAARIIAHFLERFLVRFS